MSIYDALFFWLAVYTVLTLIDINQAKDDYEMHKFLYFDKTGKSFWYYFRKNQKFSVSFTVFALFCNTLIIL